MGAVELACGWPTRSQLQASDWSYFGRVAGWLGTIGPKAEGALEKLAEGVKHPGGVEWEGAAAQAAIEQAAADLVRARSTLWSWDDVRTRLPLWQENLEGGTRLVLDAIDDAERDGFAVGDDYTVTDTRTTYASRAEYDARQAAADAHAGFIRHHLATLVGNQAAINTKLKAMTAEWGRVTFPESGGAQALDWKTGPGQPPRPPTPSAQDIREALKNLPQGTAPSIKEIRGEQDLRDLWDWLTENAKGFDGGSNHGSTIDVRYPDKEPMKVHVNAARGGVPSIPAPPGEPAAPKPAPEQSGRAPVQPRPAQPMPRAPAAPAQPLPQAPIEPRPPIAGAPGQPFGPHVVPPAHAHPHWLGETPEEEWEEGPASGH